MVTAGRDAGHPPALTLHNDPLASRTHAAFELSGGALRVEDRGSRNGVFLNGQRIARAPLGDGDVVRLGGSLFVVRFEDSDQTDVPSEELLGNAPAMQRLRVMVRRVGASDAIVLLQGESGSGKEVVARELHRVSGRGGRFVAVNCSAIPASLAESQLFGHVAGAFTGAHRDQLGLFPSADRGTLLLDELGEMSRELQPKLLRALEQRSVLPVGATQPVTFDTRVVAATNVPLRQAVATGSFRADLYARVAQITVHIPPLRERREDVLMLLARHLGTPAPPLKPTLAEALVCYAWPFNVRELIGVATELRVKASPGVPLDLALLGDRLLPIAAWEPMQPPAPAPSPPMSPVDAPSDRPSAAGVVPGREELMTLLERFEGNLTHVARAAGRSRTQVYRWLEQYGLDATQYRRR